MLAQLTPHWHLVWMAAVLFLMAYLGSPRHLGNRASQRVKRLLKQSLEKRRYSQFHDILLPTGGGNDWLDHLLVSRFGVFVIVSEYRPGEISGGESQELWKQKRFGKTRRWPNPVHRAKLHAEALRRNLDLPESRVFTVVVIDGPDALSSDLPSQVVSVGKLIPFLRSRSQELLSPEQADRLTLAIGHLHLHRPRQFSGVTMVRLLLALGIGLGVYLNYGESLKHLFTDFSGQVERLASPGNFTEEGERKSEQQLFEESLMCAWSADTNRCSCYQQGGEKVEIGLETCRELAERGSIGKQ